MSLGIEHLVEVEAALASHNLDHPKLACLQPTKDPYSVALLQPEGAISVDRNAIARVDEDASKKMSAFVKAIVSRDVDLAVCPEYSMPISVLQEAIKGGDVPPTGGLWIFGCESIAVANLPSVLGELQEHAVVIAEDVSPSVGKKFVAPLAYVFQSQASDDGEPTTVILVQFKVSPMGGHELVEMKSMACGGALYRFGVGREIRLVTLVCADALGIDKPLIDEIREDCLIVHIQLNTGYRERAFRAYRDVLFDPKCDRTELVCLNWSAPVSVNGAAVAAFGGSAWYSRPSDFDLDDPAINVNHAGGLYYTWSETMHSHAMFLNRDAGVYVFQASKVTHRDVPGAYSRFGLVAAEYLSWSGAAWTSARPNPRFKDAATLLGGAKPDLSALADSDPIAAERTINLSIGELNDSNWYVARKLSSLQIGQDEVLARLTVAQEDDAGAKARREAAYLRMADLDRELEVEERLPETMKDLAAARTYVWAPGKPHQNLKGSGGEATGIHLGDGVTEKHQHATGRLVERLLHSTAKDVNDSRMKRSRLVVFAVVGGAVSPWYPDRVFDFADPGTNEAFDYTETA